MPAESTLAHAADAGRRPPARRLLECRGVTKRFGGITAVDDVDLDSAPGEILGLIGHNGAGKTTLFDCISGFLDARRRAHPAAAASTSPTWRPTSGPALGLGRSFQEARLFPSLTVAETIAVALERHLPNRERRWPPRSACPASIETERDVASRSTS